MAEQLPDHRRLYLDYEGSISGGRGTVTEWDSGSYTVIRRNDQVLEIAVEGRTMKGVIALQLMDPACQRWRYRVI